MENSEIKDILLTKDEISLKVKELAEKINLDYAGKEIIIIGILKGCFVFMSDLIRELDLSLQVQFMEVSSYGDGTISRGDITIKKDVCVDISGRDVIIVEDIIDSGITLSRLKKILLKRNPKSLKICTLLSKPSRREV
ncbi:MAG: hypoxanthine phosphoribosyltransferase, partial [Oscillospiraceae bacterium]